MMERHIQNNTSAIGIHQLMTELYSLKWIYHPDRNDQRRKLELYLGSLVIGGEIVKNNSDYEIAGKAITTIEKYEEEERRHAEQVRMQSRTLWLTLIIALLALVQANVIKLPTVFDFAVEETIQTNQ